MKRVFMNSHRSITREDPYRIVFVCLGNICRSPTAEGVMQHLVNERGLQSYFYIDSAGTSAYHIGEPANSKSRQTANKHGMKLHSRARRFEAADLEEFDLIFAMDHENYRNILRLDSRGSFSDKVLLMRTYDTQSDDEEVPDPYYGGMDGFQLVFDVLHRSCENLLDELEQHVESNS
jgi:protein-tyrosine phosphatase